MTDQMAVVALLVMLALAARATVAEERPPIGEPAPMLAVPDLTGKPRPLTEVKGRRGLVILFWAGWSDRSIEELKRLDAVSADLSAHGVTGPPRHVRCRPPRDN